MTITRRVILPTLRVFFNSVDEDSEDDVADADSSPHDSRFAAQSFPFMWFELHLHVETLYPFLAHFIAVTLLL